MVVFSVLVAGFLVLLAWAEEVVGAFGGGEVMVGSIAYGGLEDGNVVGAGLMGCR